MIDFFNMCVKIMKLVYLVGVGGECLGLAFVIWDGLEGLAFRILIC